MNIEIDIELDKMPTRVFLADVGLMLGHWQAQGCRCALRVNGREVAEIVNGVALTPEQSKDRKNVFLLSEPPEGSARPDANTVHKVANDGPRRPAGDSDRGEIG